MRGFLLLILFIVVIYLGVDIITTIENSQKKLKINVGKSVVIEKDTLLIIDYSLFNNTYILSNKSEISSDLFDKVVIKK